MVKLSEALLDFQDDTTGEILRAIFPDTEDIPDSIKTADIKNKQVTQLMPTDRFAYVGYGPEGILKKFACVDPGSVVLQALYFSTTGKQMPNEDQAQTIKGLQKFAQAYGVVDEVNMALNGQTKKAAPKLPVDKGKQLVAALLGMGTVGAGAGFAGSEFGRKGERNAWNQVAGDMARAGDPLILVRNKGRKAPFLAAARGPQGKYHPTAQISVRKKESSATRKALAFAGITGAGAVGGLFGHGRGRATERSSWNAAQISAAERGDPAVVLRERGHKKPFTLFAKGPKGKFRAIAQTSASRKKEQEKKASYPMNGYTQVKQAERYFLEHGRKLHPLQRREMAIKLASALQQHQQKVPVSIAKYGSADIDPMVIDNICVREPYVTDDKQLQVLYNIKTAAANGLQHEKIASLLTLFDETTGLNRAWDTYIPDPCWSSFGNMEKIAQEIEILPGEELEEFLQDDVNAAEVDELFGEGSAEQMKQDPVAIYESLPNDHREILDGMMGK